MKTIPPVSPTVTTTSFVQNGQPSFPLLTSSAERSISTHKLQMTHSAAAKWNKTAQNSRRRSIPDMSKLRHYKDTKQKLVLNRERSWAVIISQLNLVWLRISQQSPCDFFKYHRILNSQQAIEEKRTMTVGLGNENRQKKSLLFQVFVSRVLVFVYIYNSAHHD